MQPETNGALEGAEALQPQSATLQPAHAEPSIIRSIFHSIFVETIRDFFGGIKNFFLRYIRHFGYCFRYIWQPALRFETMKKLDWKENCQQSFEFSFLVALALLFLIKMDWIPVTAKDLQELYGNDLHSMGIEFFLFFAFAIGYLLLAAGSILTGRLLRLMFSFPLTRRETDILFTYLNNTMFTFTAALAFVFRCSMTVKVIDELGEDGPAGLFGLLMILFFFPLLLWGIRFVLVHRMSVARKIFFVLAVPFCFSIFFGLSAMIIALILLGM